MKLADIREVARLQIGAARAALPGEMFTDHEIAWQITVRGHLTAALAAVPGDGYTALTHAIAEVLAAVEQRDEQGDR